MIRIGTSGWVYKHWRGLFYPEALPQNKWFSHYADRFPSVEINNSFYRLPSEKAFEGWRKQAPDGFLYALKASRYLTHLKKLKDPQEPLQTFFQRAVLLEDKLGPILYQLPPHWGVDLERFEIFLATLPSGYRHAIEFRDPSWLVEEVFRRMELAGVAHCIHDMHPLEVPQRVTSNLVYLRFHGVQRYSGDYPVEHLDTWAKQIQDWAGQGLDVFAYFNNDIGGYAFKNAIELTERLRSYSV